MSKKELLPYTYTLPASTSFAGKGLSGYSFGPLRQDLDVYYVEVDKGHDTFIVSKKIARTYYVLSGSGHFVIDNQRYDVRSGMVVEVPPGVEYTYSGKMTLIVFSRPRWFRGNEIHTRWNPDVIHQDFPDVVDRESFLIKMLRLRILGKSPVRAYLRLNQALWNRLPLFLSTQGPMRMYADFLHALARAEGVRAQAFSTYFLRNRPELELIRRLVECKSHGSTQKVAFLGCSTGAEAYSVAWRIRSARPDLKLVLHAADISKQAVEFAKRGAYSVKTCEISNTAIFERLTAAEMEDMFDTEGDIAILKPWIKEGIQWHVGDAGEEEILDLLGPQDMVVANNFLCHMDDPEAERCLRNIARLVRPNGYLFVSGIDLDVRIKVARDLGWKPVQELLEEIHEGDGCLRPFWPCHYAGLEPLSKKRPDWRIRYACAFEVAPRATASPVRSEDKSEAAISQR